MSNVTVGVKHSLRCREGLGRADDEMGQEPPLQRSKMPLSPLLSCRGAVFGADARAVCTRWVPGEDRAEGKEKQVWSPGGEGQLAVKTHLRPPALAPHLSLSRRGEGDIQNFLTLCSQSFSFDFNSGK